MNAGDAHNRGWPCFADTPFLPLFAAIALTSHFGSGAAGLLALGLATAGALVAFPRGESSPVQVHVLVVFVGVGVLANRILASRNRANASLRQSEAEFRAVWDHVALGAALVNRHGQI